MHARVMSPISFIFLAALAAPALAACSQADLDPGAAASEGEAGSDGLAGQAGSGGAFGSTTSDDARSDAGAPGAAGAGNAGETNGGYHRSHSPKPGVRTPSAVDTAAPRIVAVSPENGARGVTADALVRIEFSEPMDEASTVAAYRSSSLSAEDVTFIWNETHTVLAIRPEQPLRYAKATLEPGAAPTLPPESYAYAFSSEARDLAGNPLTGLGTDAPISFATLRQLSQQLAAVPELSGTLLSHDQAPPLFGFLSFDLDELPAGISRLLSGAVHPGKGLEPNAVAPLELRFVSAHFAVLDESAITAGPGTLLALLPYGARLDVTLSAELLDALLTSYRTRTPATRFVQTRVELGAQLAARKGELSEVFAGSELVLEYLVP